MSVTTPHVSLRAHWSACKSLHFLMGMHTGARRDVPYNVCTSQNVGPPFWDVCSSHEPEQQ
jgi:hypothetical protein